MSTNGDTAGALAPRRIGVFAKTFAGSDALTVLQAVKAAGYDSCQFNFACAGLPAMPDQVPPAILAAIAAARAATGVGITALSGTCNLIHPDPEARADGLRRLHTVIAAAAELQIPLVTLCTGTRDPDDPWRAHPGNTAPDAWADLIASLTQATAAARRAGVRLGIEPEPGNVVTNAAAAARLLEAFPDLVPDLVIVYDPANLIEHQPLADHARILRDALALLRPAIGLIHAKDRDADGAVAAPGQGVVDFPRLADWLAEAGLAQVPVIGHGYSEAEAPAVAAFLRQTMPCASGRPAVVRAGRTLAGKDTGGQGNRGPAVVFQHGLGGGEGQVAEVFPADFRRLTLECRNHGASADGGPWSLATFTDDVLAFADARGAATFVAGGISMGAAIALKLAAQQAARVRGLILIRPAWVTEPGPAHLTVYAEAADYLERGDKAGFAATASARRLAAEGPDNLASLLGFFDRPDRARLPGLLRAIVADGPGVPMHAIQSLALPTLVIGCDIDPVHPLAFARMLAAAIPGARLVEVTPKAVDRERHAVEVRSAISAFLNTIPLEPS